MTYYIATGEGDFMSPDYKAAEVTVLHYVQTDDIDRAIQMAEFYYTYRVGNCLNDWQGIWTSVVSVKDPVEALVEIRG